MSNDIKIRVCSSGDLDKIMKIENECFEHPYPEYVFKDYLGSELFLVAENQSEIVGYIITDVRKKEGVVISIAVEPDFQRKGIGKELISKTIDKLSTEYIVLTVRMNNEGAQKFYIELNFERLYVINEYYENNDDAIVMGKKLQKDE